MTEHVQVLVLTTAGGAAVPVVQQIVQSSGTTIQQQQPTITANNLTSGQQFTLVSNSGIVNSSGPSTARKSKPPGMANLDAPHLQVVVHNNANNTQFPQGLVIKQELDGTAMILKQEPVTLNIASVANLKQTGGSEAAAGAVDVKTEGESNDNSNGVGEKPPQQADSVPKTFQSKRFMCNLCERSFMHKQSLDIHMRSHTGEHF